jgi:hypothetical protein
MTHVTVFDPAMCCSTGVCGPSVDPKLVTFAADLDWLASQGVTVVRHNLAQAPAAFLADPDAKATIETKGEEGLPLVKIDGVVRSSGAFPARAELAAWAGLGAATESIYSAAVAELLPRRHGARGPHGRGREGIEGEGHERARRAPRLPRGGEGRGPERSARKARVGLERGAREGLVLRPQEVVRLKP